MKKNHIPYYPDRKWLMPLGLFCLLFLIFLLIVTSDYPKSSSDADFSHSTTRFVLEPNGNEMLGLGLPPLPRFAYLISGTKGDGGSMRRLLQAAYHPRNYYLLHLDLEASDSERLELAKYVKSESVFREFRNVMVVGKANLITDKGPTMIASTLQAIAILLKRAKDWDWFINLSASDYPLLPQDGSFFSSFLQYFSQIECLIDSLTGIWLLAMKFLACNFIVYIDHKLLDLVFGLVEL